MNYTIGEFSRITRFSVKTLRYYHEIGLLDPTENNDVTDNHYYDDNSFECTKIF